jgi:lipoate-protein ligase B
MSLGYERRTTVQEIVELSLSADKLRLQAQKVESDFAYTTERYKRFNVNANTNVTRIQKLFNMLDNAIYYIPEGDAKTEFEARVQAAKNSEETMIGYFRELYDEGMTLAIKLINDTAQEKQLTYLAITNGGASTYHNPVTNPTNVANKL